MFDWESCQKQGTGADVVRSADLIVDQNAPVRAEGSGPQKARSAFTYICSWSRLRLVWRMTPSACAIQASRSL
jgi:hypothetical protein